MLLTVPATNERGPKFMEKALATIHQSLSEGSCVSLEYGDYQGKVGLFLEFLRDSKILIETFRNIAMNVQRVSVFTLTTVILQAVYSGIGFADDWPQWLGPSRDGVWHETGLVEKFPARGLTI